MRVSTLKDLANHKVSESCVVVGNCDGEALTGGDVGQVLSRENMIQFGVPTPWTEAEGNTELIDSARSARILRGRRP